MAIKNYKPVNNSRRGMTVTDYSGLSKVAPEKSLLEPVKKTAGRNSYGRITVRHIGGGNRKKYRVIDFKRDKQGMNATPFAQAATLISSPATLLHWLISLLVPLSTTSRCTPVRALRWFVLLVTWLSSWLRRTAWLLSVFPAAS